MCSRLRTYAIRKLNVIDVELSWESGCDIYGMMNWLKTSEGRGTVGNKDFVVFCLGTNDVGRYGVEETLKRCSEIIGFVRQSFPGIRAIGWLALSPRWKPTRFVAAVEIGQLHNQFNECLQVLSKQLDFDVVDARLGPSDMRVEDGLHPSATTGKWKYEEALRVWFSSRAVAHSSSSSFQIHHNTTTSTLNNNNNNNNRQHYNVPSPSYYNNNNNNNNNYHRNISPHSYHHHYNNNNNFIRNRSPSPYHHNLNYNNNRNNLTSPYRHHNSNSLTSPYRHHNNNLNRNPSYHRNVNNNNHLNYHHQQNIRSEINSNIQNSTQPFIVTSGTGQLSNKQPSFPSQALIKFYPNKLRRQEQYFRENEPPKEVEKEKEKLFLAANLFYQYRYFEEEGKKWRIYEKVSSRKEKVFNKDGDDILMEEVDEIPQTRPFTERHVGILNITVSDSDSQSNRNTNSSNNYNSETSNSDTDEDDKKKRKLRDTSISPTVKKRGQKPEINIRKKKEKSKKKKKTPIENDPRAPEGSPILLISGNTKRADTPTSPSAKKQRLFSHIFKPQREVPPSRECLTQTVRISPSLPTTPPGLPSPPVISPRQSTPRTPVPSPKPLVSTPNPVTSHTEGERIHPQLDRSQPATTVANERIIPMEQEIVSNSPSAISKDSEINSVDLFDFPIIPIECKFYFKIFKVSACASTISTHREFLEKKSVKAEKELEQLMKEFPEEQHRTVVQYIKNSIEPLIDILKISNQKRLDNLILDQMREKALRTIRKKCDKGGLEYIEQVQNRFERSLQLRFQLDKLDRRLNENMPPPALNIMDKLQFRSKELDSVAKEQYSEQWNSVIRKAKLDLTSIMRLAKVAEIDKSEKEHLELVEKIPVGVRPAYSELVHTVKVRQDRVVQKKLHFLERRVQRTIED